MNKRTVIVDELVQQAIVQIADFIENQYSAPLAAEKFVYDIWQFIAFIGRHPEIYPLNYYDQLRCYGSSGLRRTVFRDKWVILYEMDSCFVYIKKILHTSTIIG